MTMKELFVEAMRRTDAGDHEGFLAMQDDDASWTVPGAELQGKEQLRSWLGLFWQGFTAYGHDLQRLYEDGEDRVICEGVWTGRNDGPLTAPDGSQVPPTGREASFRFAIVVSRDPGAEVACEVRLYFDQLEFLAQLGLVPDAAAV
jgi:ketosteroid isomerase-like protein